MTASSKKKKELRKQQRRQTQEQEQEEKQKKKSEQGRRRRRPTLLQPRPLPLRPSLQPQQRPRRALPGHPFGSPKRPILNYNCRPRSKWHKKMR